MANRLLRSKLLGAELLGNPVKCSFERIRLNAPGVAGKQRYFPGKLIGLLGSVPAVPFVTTNLARNGGLATAKVLGNLSVTKS